MEEKQCKWSLIGIFAFEKDLIDFGESPLDQAQPHSRKIMHVMVGLF